MRLLSTIIFLISLMLPHLAHAQTSLPHVFNFHTTLRDDNGKLVESDFIDLEFQIVDGQGKVLFSESQPGVQVIRSAVAVVVGEESGGIPLEVFDPATGSKLLQYKIAGNEFSDGIELNAYPYSLWSEKALGVVDNAIGSEQIKDGSVELKDLARSIEFTDLKGITTEAQIPTAMATDTELTAHANASQAHWAKQIRVEGPFMLHTSTNVEDLLSTLDAKVYLNMVNAKEDVTKTSSTLTSSLNQEIVDRKAADTTLQTNLDTETANRKTEDTNILASEVSRAGDSVFGDLIFYSDSSLGTETLKITPAEGEMSLLGDMVRVEKDDTTGQPVIVVEDKDKNEKIRLNGQDGTITLNGSLVLSGTVDGVDVGDFSQQLDNKIDQEISDRAGGDQTLDTKITTHEGLTQAHGSDGTVVGVNTLNTAVSGLQGKIDTANTNITTLQNTTANINNLPGTLGESKINASLTRDTEVVSLVDPTFTTNAEATTIASGQITTALSNDTIPNTPAEIGAAPASHTHASGDLPSSTSYLGASIESGEISDGTITTSDMASTNISQWTNNSGYLTSANLSGYDSNAADDITTGGGTITGNLQVNGNIGVTGTVDGVDVSALSTQVSTNTADIAALKGTTKFSDIEGQIAESQVPKFMRPFAFGMLTTNVVGDVTISGSYNMKQPTGSAAVQCGVTLEFETASEDGNFLVILQEHQNSAHPRAIDKNKNGFKLCNGTPSLVDFVVYKN